MVLTLPESKRDNETDEEFSSRVQDFNPAEDFLNRYTEESTDPTKTDFSVEAYEGDKGRGFFSPDGAGRPAESVDISAGETRGFESPRESSESKGIYRSQSRPSRPRRYTPRGEERVLARDRPAVRPTGQRDVGSSRGNFTPTSRSFLGSYSRGQRTGSGAASAASTFASASSSNPNQTSVVGRWWNKGRNVNVPNESTASWGDLWRDNQRQAGQSNQNYQKGTKPGFFGRPDRAVLGVDIPESIKTRKVVTVPAEKGGPGSGPTPLVRQATERILAPVATGASIFAQGQTGSNLYQAVESAADYVPGLRSDPETDIGKRTGDFLAEKAGNVKDWFVDKMGNIRKDEQARQIRQAGLGTDIQGNVVTESQRQKAVDEFIAGVENWEPLTDQSTFEDIPAAESPVVSDVGTVNEFGEVVGPLGVQDGDQIAATYGGNKPKLDWQDVLIKKIETHTPVKGSDDYPYYGRPGSGMGDRWKGSSLPGGDEVAQVASAGDLSGLGIGATNQPATVDLNKSEVAGGQTLYGDTDYGLQEDGSLGVGDDDWGSDVDINELENLIPGLELAQADSGEKFLDDYISPQQPYDEQIPVGNYIKNEDTGEVNQLADAPISGELPSDNPQLKQQAKSFDTEPSTSGWDPGSDPGVIASERAIDSAYAAYKAASSAQQNYLGGRTAGTEAEYNEYLRLAAISDAASKRLDAAYEQQARAMQAYTSSRS